MRTIDRLLSFRADQFQESLLVKPPYVVTPRLFHLLVAGTRTDQEVISLPRHAGAGSAALAPHGPLGLVARHPIECARDDQGLARQAMIARPGRLRLNALPFQICNQRAVGLVRKPAADRFGDRGADVRHSRQASLVSLAQRLQGSELRRQRVGQSATHVRNSEGVDQPRQRNVPGGLNRVHEILRLFPAHAFERDEILRLQVEQIRRAPDQGRIDELGSEFFAQAIDVQGLL